MKYLGTAVLALLGIIALSASASAAIVCNDDGDCWRVKEKYTYPPDVRLHVYEDDYVVDTKKYKWRNQEQDAAIGGAAFGSASEEKGASTSAGALISNQK
jgi:hypothetical protein